MPQVSIIIINFNTFRLTTQCIESVYEKTQGISFEIVLVDNASLECNPDLFTEQFPEIKLVKSKENVGFAKGNNLGIASATGEFILLLNSDTKLLNNAILIAYQKLAAESNVGVVTGKLLYPDGTIQHQCGRFPSIKLQLIELLRIQKLWNPRKRGEILLGSFFNHDSEVNPDWVWGTFFMTKAAIIRQLDNQKLPDEFFMYNEDLQWCYEIKKLGYSIKYLSEALILHYFSQSTKQNKDINQYALIINNQDTFLKKNYGIFYTKFFYLFSILNARILSIKYPDYSLVSKVYLRKLFGQKI